MEKLMTYNKQGFALLLTMSILIVLSIALIHVFEERSLEVAHLENSTEQFKAESVSRSVFRVILSAIKSQKIYPVVAAIRQIPPKMNIDVIDQGSFSELTIRPIDHRFHLNQSFTVINTERVTAFKNLLMICQSESKSKTEDLFFDINDQDIYSIVSAINDWRDDDAIPDEQFLEGIEYYGSEKTPFEIKNAPFDKVTEIKIIPRFNALKISDHILKNNFRILGDKSEYIDINLASKSEISSFLKRYKDIADYETVSTNADRIAEIITLGNDDRIKPKYEIGKGVLNRDSLLQEEMEQEGLLSLLTIKERALFSVQPKFLEIKYKISTGRYKLNVTSIIKVNYASQKGDIAGFDIYTYSIR